MKTRIEVAARSMGSGLQPMLSSVELPFYRAYTAEEMQRIAAGYIPTMFPDDKWFMYYEDSVLYIYRVSSNTLTFELHFKHDPLTGLTRTTRVLGNRDPKHQLRRSPRAEARFLEMVLGGHFGLPHRDLPAHSAHEEAAWKWTDIETPDIMRIEGGELTDARHAADTVVRAFQENEGMLSSAQVARLALIQSGFSHLRFSSDSNEERFAEQMATSIRAILSHLCQAGAERTLEWSVAEAAPRDFTYWVRPDLLMAGRHPRRTGYPTMVSSLVEINGIRSFIDLSGRTAELDYSTEVRELGAKLQQPIDYFRVPVRGGAVPDDDRQMVAILDILDDCVERGRREGTRVFVHCSSGAGRTGLVVGCYLVRHGMPGHQALKQLKRLFQPLPGSASRHIPENDRQKEYILGWARRDRPRAA